MRAMEKDIAQRYPSMEAFRLDLQAIYRQLVGASARFTTAPRLSQSYRPTGSEVDPDATVATPSKGMIRTEHITPPSGALARVPARDDRTPTAATARREGGLELVNFRDPAQAAAEKAAASPQPRTKGNPLPVAIAAVFVAAVAGFAWFLYREKAERPKPVRVAAVTPAPSGAPLVFPQPIVGHEPGPEKAAEPPAAPKEPPVAVAEKKPETLPKPEAPPTPKPVRRFKIQFSSIPPAALSVDGRKVGPSIPAKVVELAEGSHTVRLEAPGLPTYEKELKIGPNTDSRFAYRFPVGFLVVSAPAWEGASVLIDSKFKGVLKGESRYQLPSGDHRVTLSREGVDPVTANVTVPEGGDKKLWTPPAPGSHPAGSS
jgi:hypothetical protein